MEITIGADVSVTAQQVRESVIFQDWAAGLGDKWCGSVTVNAAGNWGGRVRMLQLTVAPEDSPWPIMVMLRSETVDVLTIVTDGKEQYVIFVEQYREAVGARVVSNVAGGCDAAESALTTAERELREELGMDEGAVFSISFLVANPVLATPGITNERVYLMQAEVKVPPSELQAFLNRLDGKETGLKEEGEKIVLRVVPVAHARGFILRQPNPDAKTLMSLMLAGL